jgi:predicted permease
MRGFLQDLRYSFRQLKKSPGFAITAALTLALGIGANVAVFTVMNAALLNPSGIPHPQKVVALRAGYKLGDLASISLSPGDLEDAMEGKGVFTSAAGMNPANFNYSGDSATPELLQGAKVTWQWFDVFWARPLLGRVFRAEEDQPGAEHEVILSYPTWKKRFGGDEHILGRKLQLNRESYEVIGVMGPEFAWPNKAEIWTPLGLKPSQYTDPNFRFNEYLFSVARLREDKTIQEANAYLEQRSQRVKFAGGDLGSFAQSAGWHEFCMALVDYVAGDMRKPMKFLLAAVALVLLIACANIAGLQLARASGRQREVSIQIALGSSRALLLRQAFAESLLLAVGGVVIGLGLAWIAVPALLSLAPPTVSGNISAHMNGSVLAFVAAIGVQCALLCGTAPSWHMTHTRWFQALQEGGRSDSASPARQRLRSSLVVVEIAIAMLLLFGAGLLVRSLQQLEKVQTGFDPHSLMTGAITLPTSIYKEKEQQVNFFGALEDQLKNVSGAQRVAIVDALPFSNNGGSASFSIKGQTVPPNQPGPHGNVRVISSDYFGTLGIALVRGRVFTTRDRFKTQPVAIVDETLARQYWPGQDPIGQQINFGGNGADDPLRTIVGVVKHAKASSLESDTNEGFYYLPISQVAIESAFVAVRTAGAPMAVVGAVRNAVHSVDPGQALYDLKTMDDRVDSSLVGRRFLVVLLSIFAGLALLLSALGLYGVINYSVKLRTRELGVRMALGAQRGDVLQLVLGKGMQLAAVGLIAGLLASFALGRVLNSMLYNVSIFNPLSLVATSSLLAATVLLASYLPARRAAKLDPMRTLRQE